MPDSPGRPAGTTEMCLALADRHHVQYEDYVLEVLPLVQIKNHAPISLVWDAAFGYHAVNIALPSGPLCGFDDRAFDQIDSAGYYDSDVLLTPPHPVPNMVIRGIDRYRPVPMYY